MTRTWVAAALLCALCCSCVPWTVRPIGATQKTDQQKPFNARKYVESIWESRLVPAVVASAVDLRTVLNGSASPSPHRMVKGVGRVARLNTEGQAGKIGIDLLPADGSIDAEIQLGPLIRGTSLRDAPGFMQFGQFANQLEFADVANELNAKVVRDVVATARSLASRGNTISFLGTFSVADGTVPQIVPVRLELLEARK